VTQTHEHSFVEVVLPHGWNGDTGPESYIECATCGMELEEADELDAARYSNA
jgi:hypothetical protein